MRKGARQMVRDPQSGRMVRLFHPRLEAWNHHFRWRANEVIGITAVGRATVAALSLNSPEHRIIRAFEARLGGHPAPQHV
jgi:hypothetical protein